MTGYATDNVGVVSYFWSTDRGHSGTEYCTSNCTLFMWSKMIPLEEGSNTITAVAFVAEGNYSNVNDGGTVTVTYAP